MKKGFRLQVQVVNTYEKKKKNRQRRWFKQILNLLSTLQGALVDLDPHINNGISIPLE